MRVRRVIEYDASGYEIKQQLAHSLLSVENPVMVPGRVRIMLIEQRTIHDNGDEVVDFSFEEGDEDAK